MASTPHASAYMGTPPREQTVSTKRRVPISRHSSATPARDWCTPVDDSPWHRKSRAGLCCFSAAASVSSEKVVPARASSETAFAPYRDAMSTTRAPQMPLLPTSTVSPGSPRLEMHASMPACPVPDISRTLSLVV